MAKRGKRKKRISPARRKGLIRAYCIRIGVLLFFALLIFISFRLIGGIFRKTPEKPEKSDSNKRMEAVSDWSMSDMGAGEGRRWDKDTPGDKEAAPGKGELTDEDGDGAGKGESPDEDGDGTGKEGSSDKDDDKAGKGGSSDKDGAEGEADKTDIMPERLGVDIRGRVTAYISEPFDEEVYSLEELEGMIKDQITSYCALTGNDKSVELLKLKSKKGIVNTRIRYESAADYRSFNDIDFYLGDVVALTFAGVDYDKELYSTDEKKTGIEAGSTKRLSEEKLTTLAVSESMEVEVPGRIIYYSPDVQITGRSSARIFNEDGFSFVIYKPGLLAGIFTK